MATDIHELVKKLGYGRSALPGTTSAARSRSASRPTSPAVPPPGEFSLWRFAFNQVQTLPEQLLAGRFRYLIDWLFANTAFNPDAIDERSRSIYARAYNSPDAIRAGNGWYKAFHQDIADGKTYAKLTPPVLGLASVPSFEQFKAAPPNVAVDFKAVQVDDAGHWLAEEAPDAVARELTQFFGQASVLSLRVTVLQPRFGHEPGLKATHRRFACSDSETL